MNERIVKMILIAWLAVVACGCVSGRVERQNQARHAETKALIEKHHAVTYIAITSLLIKSEAYQCKKCGSREHIKMNDKGGLWCAACLKTQEVKADE